MKRRDKIVLTVLGTGLLLSSYLTTPARSAGGCLALLPLLESGSDLRQIANKAPAKKQPAPDWQLKDLDGNPVKQADFKGKVVILNFWATWCSPCRAEIPDFVALQKAYGAKGLAIVGVSIDEGGPDIVKSFAKKAGINYPVVMADAKTRIAYGGIEVVPTTFVIDKTGKIAHIHRGGVDRATFESEIKPLLR